MYRIGIITQINEVLVRFRRLLPLKATLVTNERLLDT